MNLWLALRALRKHWLLLTLSVVAGVLLATLSLYSVRIEPNSSARRFSATRRSMSVFSQTTAVVIDVPGYGLVRTDLPIAQNIGVAPAFAYIAAGPEVRARVEAQIGPTAGLSVTAEPVKDSPVLQITVEGKDPGMVAKAAPAFAQALIDYVRDYQEANNVAPDVRLVLRSIGSLGVPVEVQSRSVEIAALLFLLPVAVAVGLALVIENLARSRAEWLSQQAASSQRVDISAQAPSPGGSEPAGTTSAIVGPPEDGKSRPSGGAPGTAPTGSAL